MSKGFDLNRFIGKAVGSLLSLSGALMFAIGLFIGYLVAKNPFLVIGIVAIIGLVLYVFKDKIDVQRIKAEIKGASASKDVKTKEAPSPELPPPPPEDEKEKKKNKGYIVINLED